MTRERRFTDLRVHSLLFYLSQSWNTVGEPWSVSDEIGHKGFSYLLSLVVKLGYVCVNSYTLMLMFVLIDKYLHNLSYVSVLGC